MASAGVGVDIVTISRMERVLERTPSFRVKVFTQEERSICEGRVRSAPHYAAFFAARQAVLKALGVDWDSSTFCPGMLMHDVSVSCDEAGRFGVLLSGRAASIARKADIVQVALSLSMTHEVAVASAVALSESVRPHEQKAYDPRVELDANFKEAKHLIDELELISHALR